MRQARAVLQSFGDIGDGNKGMGRRRTFLDGRGSGETPFSEETEGGSETGESELDFILWAGEIGQGEDLSEEGRHPGDSPEMVEVVETVLPDVGPVVEENLETVKDPGGVVNVVLSDRGGGLSCALAVPYKAQARVSHVVSCLEREFSLVRVVLRFNDVVLRSNRTLESYGIRNNDTLLADEGHWGKVLFRSASVGAKVALSVPPALTSLAKMARPMSRALQHPRIVHQVASISADHVSSLRPDGLVSATGGCFLVASTASLVCQLTDRSQFESLMERVVEPSLPT